MVLELSLVVGNEINSVYSGFCVKGIEAAKASKHLAQQAAALLQPAGFCGDLWRVAGCVAPYLLGLPASICVFAVDF